MELITFKDIIVFIYQYSIIAIIVIGLIVGIYFCGKGLSKKYNVAKWYFWSTFIFALPIIGAPLVFFGSLFMDHVKHDDLVHIAWLIINSYSIWFILGFIISIKLYRTIPPYFSILPSVCSWIMAILSIWGGVYLVNY